MTPLQELSPGLSRGGVSGSIIHNTIGAGEKKIPWQKRSPAKNAQEANTCPPANYPSHKTVFTGLSAFSESIWRQVLTKNVSSIEIRKSGGEEVDVSLFWIFVFCIYINVHFLYIDAHFANLGIEKSPFAHLLMHVFKYLNRQISLLYIYWCIYLKHFFCVIQL